MVVVKKELSSKGPLDAGTLLYTEATIELRHVHCQHHFSCLSSLHLTFGSHS